MTTKFIRQGLWTCNGFKIKRRLAGIKGTSEFIFERSKKGKLVQKHFSLKDAGEACA